MEVSHFEFLMNFLQKISNSLRDSILQEFQISNTFNPIERRISKLTKDPNQQSLHLNRWMA